MSEMSGAAKAVGAESLDNAAAGVSEASELARMQGLDEGITDEPDGDSTSAAKDPESPGGAASVRGTAAGDASKSSSDPMPDMAGSGSD
jgi:hypothetical protein